MYLIRKNIKYEEMSGRLKNVFLLKRCYLHKYCELNSLTPCLNDRIYGPGWGKKCNLVCYSNTLIHRWEQQNKKEKSYPHFSQTKNDQIGMVYASTRL